MSSWFWLVIAVGTVVIAGGLADFILLGRPGYAPVPLVMDATPTLFIPGHLGTRYSFGHMLWRMQRRYGLSKDVVAIVAPDGRGAFAWSVELESSCCGASAIHR